MDNRESKNAAAVEVSASFLQRLNLYALGAATACVGILAPTSEAKVVYAPAHVVIPGGGFFLDLNHDGINDFNLNLNGNSRGHSGSGYFSAQPLGEQNLVFGHGEVQFGFRPRVPAFDLPAGAQIGPNNVQGQPEGSKLLAGYYFFNTTGGAAGHGIGGEWAPGALNRYVGFAFSVNGETHFGWARLTVSMNAFHDTRALLTGYAYETVANKAIVTGNPSGQAETAQSQPSQTGSAAQPQLASLGALALGSSGLQIWRRE
jgi:hypothetical protein